MDKLRNLLPFQKRREEEVEIQLRNLQPFQKQREQEEENLLRSHYFNKNGALVMKDMIATFGPRYNLPLRSFSLEQLIRATNNFSDFFSSYCDIEYVKFYRGSLEGRPILVKYSSCEVIRDVVVSSQMSHHKNVLPLIGCCLESPVPYMVYDNALDHQFVEEMLTDPFDNAGKSNGKVISWRNRIKIAKDVSRVFIYLHTAFSTPIIFRDLNAKRVVIDRYGVAKLVGFEHSIPLPPGELKVKVEGLNRTYGYTDPEYLSSGFVTQKSDVHTLGGLMLALLAGKPVATIECAECTTQTQTPDRNRILGTIHVLNCRHFIQDHRRIMDPKIFEEEGKNEDQILEHLLALSNLALRCTEKSGDDRPEMIDVAKQLSQMDKSVRS